MESINKMELVLFPITSSNDIDSIAKGESKISTC